MKKFKNHIWSLIFSLILGSTLKAADLKVTAMVDQTQIPSNQQFVLTVELTGKDANNAGNPELPAMDSFSHFLGSASSQNIQYINGKMSVNKTITYRFMPKKVGKFTIGPVKINFKGQAYQTDPIQIDILKASASQQSSANQRRSQPNQTTGISADDLFMRAIVSKKTAYVNEPIVLTFKLYTRVNVSSFNPLKIPDTPGFWKEEIQSEQQLQTKNEMFNGKQYTTAVVRQMVIFPMSSGTKTIDSFQAECGVKTRRRSRNSFDSFFNDSFFFGSTTPVGIKTQPISIEVKPLPNTNKPDDFSGAVGQYQIKGSIDKTSIKTNEAITYKVQVSGKGNIQSLPDLRPQFPTDFEQYPPKTSEKIQRNASGVSGQKTYEFILVPRHAGSFTIKPIQFAYFDPNLKAYRTIQIPQKKIDVAQGTDTYTSMPTGLSREEVKLVGQEIRFIKTAPGSFHAIHYNLLAQPLFWILFLLPLLGLGLGAIQNKHIKKLEGDIAYARDKGASRKAKKRLATAKSKLSIETQKAFYSELGKSLLGFLGDKLNMAEAGLMSNEVKQRLIKKQVQQETIDECFNILSTCDQKRFSPAETNENEMQELLKRAEKVITTLVREI